MEKVNKLALNNGTKNHVAVNTDMNKITGEAITEAFLQVCKILFAI